MIKSAAAKRSPAVLVVTSLVIAMALAFLLGALLYPEFHPRISFMPALMLGLLILGCYLRSPVAYELTPGNELITRFHLGSRAFGPVKQFAPIAGRLPFGLRLWGNGGLFAGTGIFWNRSLGIFRAYVTNGRRLVLVETQDGRKIFISPENPADWNRRIWEV